MIWGRKFAGHIGSHFFVGVSARIVIHMGTQFLILKFPKQQPDLADLGQRRDPVDPGDNLKQALEAASGSSGKIRKEVAVLTFPQASQAEPRVRIRCCSTGC